MASGSDESDGYDEPSESDKPGGSGNKKKGAKGARKKPKRSRKKGTSQLIPDASARRKDRAKFESRLNIILGEGPKENPTTDRNLYYRWGVMYKQPGWFRKFNEGVTQTKKVRRTPRVTRFLTHMTRNRPGYFFVGESERSIDILSDPAKHAWLQPVKIPSALQPPTHTKNIMMSHLAKRRRHRKELEAMTEGEDPNRMLYYKYRDHLSCKEVFNIPYSKARLKQLQKWSSPEDRIKIWTKGDPGLLGEIWITDESEDEGDINFEGKLVGLKTDQMAEEAVDIPPPTQKSKYKTRSQPLSQLGSSKKSPVQKSSDPSHTDLGLAAAPSTTSASKSSAHQARLRIRPTQVDLPPSAEKPRYETRSKKLSQSGSSKESHTHHGMTAGLSTSSASSSSGHHAPIISPSALESNEVKKRKAFLEKQKQILETELAKFKADLKSDKKGKRKAKKQRLSSPVLTSPETIFESPVRPIDLPQPTKKHSYSTRSKTLSESGASKGSPVKFFHSDQSHSHHELPSGSPEMTSHEIIESPESPVNPFEQFASREKEPGFGHLSPIYYESTSPQLIGPSTQSFTSLLDPWNEGEYYQGYSSDLLFPDINFDDIIPFGSNQDISGETSTAQSEDNQQIMLEILRRFNEDQRHYENMFATDYSQPTTLSRATHPSSNPTSTQSYASVPTVQPWNEANDQGGFAFNIDRDETEEPDIYFWSTIFRRNRSMRNDPHLGNRWIRLSPESQQEYGLSELVTERDYYARRAQILRQRIRAMGRTPEFLAELAREQADRSGAGPSRPGSSESGPSGSSPPKRKKKK